jgi:hypothetical protein
MSLLTTILGKLGFKTAGAAPASQQQAQQQGQQAQQYGQPSPGARPASPMAIPTVDVVSKLEGMAASHSEKLNWRSSIVDLLKLLGIDSSLQARKDLAMELGCPPEKMADSAQMNMWLHKAVLQKLAENGGNVPPELLD